GVTRDVACEGWADEGGALVRPPVVGQNPAHTGVVALRIVHVVGSAPGVELDLAHVLVVVAGQRVASFHQLHIALDQRDTLGIVVGERVVGALTHRRHVADGGDGAHIVVPALDAPGRHSGVVYRAAEHEVDLDVPLQVGQLGALTLVSLHQVRVVRHRFVDDGEPVTRGRLGGRTVRPE